MKAISLLQPWASLMGTRFKQLETRSWATRYRGLVAIHASKGFSRDDRELAMMEPFATALVGERHRADVEREAAVRALPRGAVIAIGTLVDCRCITQRDPGPPEDTYESYFGNYGEGRYMWWIKDIRLLAEPIPAKGQLSLWEWDAPADWEARLLPLAPLRAKDIWAEAVPT